MTRFPIDLATRVLACLADDDFQAAPSSMLEPTDFVTDVDRWERERRQFFEYGPQIVAWGGELAGPGSFITREVCGVPVLITRVADGSLRAFRNACTHRGTEVATGCGTARRLTCPYHGWTFDLEGRLVGQTQAGAFDDLDVDTLGLPPLPVAEPAGLVVVGLHGDVDVTGALDPLAAELAWCGYGNHELVGRRTFTLQANWKIAADVNLEAYHVAHLHRDTLHHFVTNHFVYDLFGRHARFAFPRREASDIIGVGPEGWPAGEEPFIVVHVFFPNTVLIETSNSSQMFRIEPGRHIGEATMEISEASNVPITGDADRELHQMQFDMLCTVLETEDFPQAELSSRGAATSLDHFVFGRIEPMLQHAHRVWRSELAD